MPLMLTDPTNIPTNTRLELGGASVAALKARTYMEALAGLSFFQVTYIIANILVMNCGCLVGVLIHTLTHSDAFTYILSLFPIH